MPCAKPICNCRRSIRAFRNLPKQITAHADNPYDKARAIEGYLRSHYGYTLDLTGPPQADPLAYFLFQKRAGHCEYFAAAMTVMLRSVGIPARYINGFLTGEYNDVGGDFVVRASDAHSWVEVYFPAFGWLTFDPTPPSDEKPPGFFATLGHYWDWFELQWSEWVINYDFVHQFTLAQNLQRVSRDWTERVQDDVRECAHARPPTGWNAGNRGSFTRPRRCRHRFAISGALFIDRAASAAGGPAAVDDPVAFAHRSRQRDDAAPGDAPIQRNAAPAGAARHSQIARPDAAGICDVAAGRKSCRARARTDRNVPGGALRRTDGGPADRLPRCSDRIQSIRFARARQPAAAPNFTPC